MLTNQRFEFFPNWHYAVLVGYDVSEATAILRSGTQERAVMKLKDFDRAWSKADRWAFVAVAPDRLPATAVEDAYVSAAVTLERVAPAAATTAYATALAKWPGNLIARMGLGNVAYRRHDLTTAESEYRRAIADHPDSGDAWNNLAQVLHEQKRDSDAVQAAQRAVAIGGPRLLIYRSTLAGIETGAAAFQNAD